MRRRRVKKAKRYSRWLLRFTRFFLLSFSLSLVFLNKKGTSYLCPYNKKSRPQALRSLLKAHLPPQGWSSHSLPCLLLTKGKGRSLLRGWIEKREKVTFKHKKKVVCWKKQAKGVGGAFILYSDSKEVHSLLPLVI